MKNVIAFLLALAPCISYAQADSLPNIFVITTDGFRWQELFEGADSSLLANTVLVKDTGQLKQLFWNSDPAKRRSLLMPFTWRVLAAKGSLYGNRKQNSKVSVANPYNISYAGYNEIFTGYADPAVKANRKKFNSNQNVLDFLNDFPEYKGKIAAFTSWNLFEYIFNGPRTNIYLNSGYEQVKQDSLTATEQMLNGVQEYLVAEKQPTRNDMLTFVAAKEYIQARHPRVMYIGFGETDEAAHHGDYDEYLQSAHMFDEYLAQLWYLVNNDPFYKGRTSFIITTDHGRGKKTGTWSKHGMFTAGSSETWLMTIGPNNRALGEVRGGIELFNEQLAQTIAEALGKKFVPAYGAAEPVYSITKQ